MFMGRCPPRQILLYSERHASSDMFQIMGCNLKQCHCVSMATSMETGGRITNGRTILRRK